MSEKRPIELLETVVYMSSETAPMSGVALHGLLSKARSRNRAVGVTGVLLYAEGGFCQVLEGPGCAVTETLDRIRQDNRHKGLIEIHRGIIRERVFPEWSMGYRHIEQNIEGLFSLSRTNVSLLSGEQGDAKVCVLLKQFFNSAYPYATV